MRALLVLPLVLGLAACNSTKSDTSPSALEKAVQDVQSMSAEQKYQVACNSADALVLAYRAFIAPKQTANVNARVEASYAAIQVVCVNRPENYATALVSLVQAVNAFKAALPKAA